VGGYILDVLDILLMQMLEVIDISAIIIYSLYKKSNCKIKFFGLGLTAICNEELPIF
jgi:hypothetical protein